jgi:demethylmenaquinone methyltransferase/2-methoxy-6-polyprenyl-1,4-benzoquinol methylase
MVPLIGALLSDRQAYAYLPASMTYLPSESALRGMIERAGFAGVRLQRLGAGSVQLLSARRAAGAARERAA